MTATDSEVIEKYETTTIEALDFEIPCDLSETYSRWPLPRTIPCPHPAAWVLVMRAHHPEHAPVTTLLICQSHYEYIVNGGPAWCDTAKAYYRPHDFIIRLEPLKPPSNGDSK